MCADRGVLGEGGEGNTLIRQALPPGWAPSTRPGTHLKKASSLMPSITAQSAQSVTTMPSAVVVLKRALPRSQVARLITLGAQFMRCCGWRR